MKFKIDCPEGCWGGLFFVVFYFVFVFVLRHNKAKMSSLWERSPYSFSPGVDQSLDQETPARLAAQEYLVARRLRTTGDHHTSHSLAGCWWQVQEPYSLMITRAPSMWLGL